MLFKTLRPLVICILLLLNLSCSEFLTGKRKTETVIKLEGSTFDCFDTAAEVLQKFDRMKTQPEDIQQSLSCIQEGLSYFKAKTKGTLQDPDNYTSDHLRRFFGKFLGDNSRVSSQMASEMMQLKAALFAGSNQSMSKAELQSLIDLIQVIKTEIDVLKPHWKLLLVSQEKTQVSLEQIRQAQQVLALSLDRVLQKTELHRTDYSLENFKNLVFEIEKFTKIGKAESENLEMYKWFPVMEAVKGVLFGGSVDVNSRAKWKEAIHMVSELLRFYLIYTYQLDQHPLISKPGLKAGDEAAVLMLNLFDSSWLMKSGGISFRVTQRLFESLHERDLLPDDISVQSIDQTYRNLVIKVFERESRNPIETVTGFEKKHLSFLKTEYEVWKNTQNFVDSFPEIFQYSLLEDRLKNFKFVATSNFPDVSLTTVEQSWDDWIFHLSQNIPMLYMPTGELILSNQVKKIPNWPWYSLARLNLKKTLTRSLMLGYGVKKTTNLKNEGLTEQSMIDWYDDYGLLGIEIKAFDPRGGNSGKRSFFEANQFVMAANGNDFMDRQEAYEFVNLIFSSGLSGLKAIQNKLTSSGCELSERDVFDNPWLNEVCFKSTLRAHFSDFFKNLPGLKHYIRGLNETEWDEFYEQLLLFARAAPENVGKIETSDIRTSVVIIHYIESMYLRFDTNLDDRLSKEELIEASQRFVPFFKKQYGLSSTTGGIRDRLYQYVVSQGFACMVLTGKMPTFTGCSKVFLQDAWEDRYSDRLRILKTLNQFKAQVQ